MSAQPLDRLRALPLFARLSEEAFRTVAARTVVRDFPANALLFRKDEPCRGLYVVLDGSVRVYRASRDGREQVLHVQGPGQPLAEVPLFDGGTYPASARAEVASRTLFLSAEDFQALFRSQPEIAEAVIRELGRRLRRMVRLVEKISLRDVPARVAMTLCEYAEAGPGLLDGAELRLPRTQEELASELATTRESVARAFGRLRSTGAIAQRGPRITIMSAAALEAAASGG
jgi:CRP/FNR family transcriptional regulator, cyclic AMP receptor protein